MLPDLPRELVNEILIRCDIESLVVVAETDGLNLFICSTFLDRLFDFHVCSSTSVSFGDILEPIWTEIYCIRMFMLLYTKGRFVPKRSNPITKLAVFKNRLKFFGLYEYEYSKSRFQFFPRRPAGFFSNYPQSLMTKLFVIYPELSASLVDFVYGARIDCFTGWGGFRNYMHPMNEVVHDDMRDCIWGILVYNRERYCSPYGCFGIYKYDDGTFRIVVGCGVSQGDWQSLPPYITGDRTSEDLSLLDLRSATLPVLGPLLYGAPDHNPYSILSADEPLTADQEELVFAEYLDDLSPIGVGLDYSPYIDSCAPLDSARAFYKLQLRKLNRRFRCIALRLEDLVMKAYLVKSYSELVTLKQFIDCLLSCQNEKHSHTRPESATLAVALERFTRRLTNHLVVPALIWRFSRASYLNAHLNWLRAFIPTDSPYAYYYSSRPRGVRSYLYEMRQFSYVEDFLVKRLVHTHILHLFCSERGHPQFWPADLSAFVARDLQRSFVLPLTKVILVLGIVQAGLGSVGKETITKLQKKVKVKGGILDVYIPQFSSVVVARKSDWTTAVSLWLQCVGFNKPVNI